MTRVYSVEPGAWLNSGAAGRVPDSSSAGRPIRGTPHTPRTSKHPLPQTVCRPAPTHSPTRKYAKTAPTRPRIPPRPQIPPPSGNTIGPLATKWNRKGQTRKSPLLVNSTTLHQKRPGWFHALRRYFGVAGRASLAGNRAEMASNDYGFGAAAGAAPPPGPPGPPPCPGRPKLGGLATKPATSLAAFVSTPGFWRKPKSRNQSM